METQNHKSLTELYPNLGNEGNASFLYNIIVRRVKGGNGVPHWELKLLWKDIDTWNDIQKWNELDNATMLQMFINPYHFFILCPDRVDTTLLNWEKQNTTSFRLV